MALLGRTRRLTRHEWRVVLEAAALTPVAAAAVRGLPLPKAVGLLRRVARVRRASRPIGSGVASLTPDRVATLVEWVGSVLSARCLVRALVLHAVLSRRGEPSEVVVGAAPDGPAPGVRGGGLLAHAWVEHQGTVLMGAAAVPYVAVCRLGGDALEEEALA